MKRQKIQYVPPKQSEVAQFARTVCRHLVKRKGNHWADEKQINSFVEFMQIVVRLETHHRNRLVQQQEKKNDQQKASSR